VAGPKAVTTTAARGRGGPVGAIESLAKFLIHYPSYIWLAAAIGHIELYFYPYIAVNALYAARELLSVAFRFGRFEPIK
jgi:hypothetical protein